jgi:aspartate kinase
MVSTSEIKISTLVERGEARRALRAVHRAFQLDRSPELRRTELTVQRVAITDAADIVARLQGVDMEELMIDDVSLDQSQARITISGVADTPGVAARVFQEVADAGILVDMIVQSCDHPGGQADLSFTVPRDKLDESLGVADYLARTLACQEVTSSPRAAKLSVSGVGLRSHTGVASRMFRSLSEAGVNVEMINTSEVRVNVVVDGELGEKGLECLQAAFADVMR